METIIFFFILSFLQVSLSEPISRNTKLINTRWINSTNLEISWEKLKNQRRLQRVSCPPLHFEVKVKLKNNLFKSWKVSRKLDYVVLNEETISTVQKVQMQVVMCDGSLISTPWKKIIRKKKVQTKRHILLPPSSLNVVPYSNTLIVRWQPPVAKQRINGYMVSYGEQSPDVFFKYASKKQTNLTLSGLKFLTKYVVGVRSYHKHQRSSPIFKSASTENKISFGFNVPRFEASSLPSPTNLTLRILSSTSLYLQWTDPSLLDEQVINDERFYAVYFSTASRQKNSSVIVKALQVTIHDLEPNQWYQFKVRTIKGVLFSPFTEEILGKTLKLEVKNISSEKQKKSTKKRESKSKRHQRLQRHPLPGSSSSKPHTSSFRRQSSFKFLKSRKRTLGRLKQRRARILSPHM